MGAVRHAGIALTVALVAVPARAQEKTSPKLGDKDADVVITGTRTPERSQRATVKVDVVTREEAERRGATNVAEALSTQPGVQVNPSAYGFLGGVGAIQIQGFDRDRVLVLEDGERVVGDIGGAIDLSNISIGDVSRIEIVTGPTSSLYGSSAIGGVVNVLTAPPVADGLSGRARLEGRTGPAMIVTSSGAWRAKRTWVGMDANYTYTNSLRARGRGVDPTLPDLQVPRGERGMLGVRGGFALSERVDVRLRARWMHDRADGLSSQVVPALGRFLIDLPEETNRFTVHAITNVDLGKGSTLRMTLGQQRYFNETAQDRRASPVDEVHDRQQRMQSFETVVTIADGPRTWVGGTRFEAESFRQQITKTDVIGGKLSTQQNDELVPLTLSNGAVYGQLQWKMGPLTVLPGLRGELNSRYGGAAAPRMAAALKLGKVAIVRASVGRGFRAPSGKELGFVFDHSFFGYRVIGNSTLRPETSWGVNGDVTVNPTPDFALRAGGYANWIEDLIDIDIANGVQSGSVVTYSYKNFGHARTMGTYLGASARLGKRFRADVSYDYLFTRDDDGEQPLGGRPPHTVTCSGTWSLPWKLELYGRTRSVTDAFLSATSRAPGYTTVDVRVARELWPRAQVYLGILNLLDARQDPGRVGDLRPPLGRVFYAGIRGEIPSED
jgi:outer membrane receptor for ferrienterochelin and colicins